MTQQLRTDVLHVWKSNSEEDSSEFIQNMSPRGSEIHRDRQFKKIKSSAQGTRIQHKDLKKMSQGSKSGDHKWPTDAGN
ncbi:hypothetical protein STEG23_027008 [Scotinomys teguina]